MKRYIPPQGETFAGILEEMHQHVFEDMPDESHKFVLSVLEREYIAYSLSVYYDCEHCQKYHALQLRKLQDESSPHFYKKLQDQLGQTTWFMRTDKRYVSHIEWTLWLGLWTLVIRRMDKRLKSIGIYIALAIGIARKDEALMTHAIEKMTPRMNSVEEFKAIIRDVDRVVVFMKAATSKNRTDPIIKQLFDENAVKITA